MQLQSEDKSIDMYLAVAQAPAALAGPGCQTRLVGTVIRQPPAGWL